MPDQTLILGPDGQPLRRDDLTREVAAATVAGVRRIWSDSTVAANLTPDRLAALLSAANRGDHREYLTLAEEMEERDAHYASVLGTRRRAVGGIEPMVEAATDEGRDVEIADSVRRLVRQPEFGDLVDDLLDALGKGFSVVEILWRRGKTWIPDRYEWRDPRWFAFDKTDGKTLRLVDQSSPENGLELQPYRFVIHRPRMKSGLPIRSGLARLVAVAHMCKSYAVADWLSFAEIYGQPLRVGKYGSKATDEDIGKLIDALVNLGTDAAAVIPESMRIEFQNAGAAGNSTVFQNLAEWLDRQVSKAVLGQTMTADDGSSQSQAQVHNDVRQDIEISDARQLENTINRDLIRPFVDINYGPQDAYPRVRFPVQEPEDLEAMVLALEKLVPLGLRVEQSVVRDKLGLPDPDDGALLLAAPTPTPPAESTAANQEHNCATCAALNREKPAQVIDEIEAAALEDWEQQMAPVLNPVAELAESAQSFEEFLERLPTLTESMDSTKLVESLARAAFQARGLGDATDD